MSFHLPHILLLTFIQLWALPGFMRHGESLKWLIDRASVLFPSALPESATQWFADVARDRADGNHKKRLCLPKQKTKIPTSGNHLNPEAKVSLDDKGCLEKAMRKQFNSRLFSPKATGLLRGCRQNVSCISRRPTMTDEKNIINGRTCDEGFLADTDTEWGEDTETN